MLRHVAKFLLILVFFAHPSAFALDVRKTAEALATRAARAFESGNMIEAATLYRDAFKIDSSESAYLYGAARAAHTGHDLAAAERDYATFLETPGAEPGRVEKAKVYLEAVHQELAARKAAEAQVAADAGDSLLASTLFLEAWHMAPDQPEPLLKAALLERKLGDKPKAIENLRRYLQLAPQNATGRGTAEALIKELGGKPAVAQPAPERPVGADKPAVAPKSTLAPVKQAATPIAKPAPRGIVAAQPAAAAPSRTIAGWTTIGFGSAAVLTSGIFAILAKGQQNKLDGNLLADGNFDGRKISVNDAATEQSSINSKWTTTAVAAGAGVAAIGVGIWLVARARADVAVVPTWDGFTIAGRF